MGAFHAKMVGPDHDFIMSSQACRDKIAVLFVNLL
jgi:hypothetical protein